jgi:uroporphyrinogen decarboxylase
MKQTKNRRFLDALLRQPVDATPVWMMRQAGRYLPEYRALREKAGSFMNLCQNPELACEITLQPLQRFPLDAAIVFSDILTIPDAMGLGLNFVEGEGPVFANPIRTAKDIQVLQVPEMNSALSYVMETIRLVRQELADRVPLIGFSGSPWTLATYMVEGGSSKTFSLIKKLLYKEPELLHQLLNVLAQAVTAYLNAQIAAGAQAVMLFDTWGGILSTRDYQEFSLAYMRQIISGLKREAEGEIVPVILFTKNGGQWLEMIAESGCDAIGLDWMTDIALAKQRVGHKVALQGNLDPAVLYADPEVIQTEVELVLADYGPHPGHVFNLGHGIQLDTPVENVAAFIEAVHMQSRRYHQG